MTLKQFCLAMAFGLAGLPSTASGQLLDAHLALARVCASEAGLRVDTNDCAAIHEVLSGIADRHHISFVSAARAYSTRVFDRRRSDSRAWIAFLHPDAREPRHWPSEFRTGRGTVIRHAPWGAMRGLWRELYALAGAIIHGDVQNPCETAPHHWGGAMDRHRAVRAGWVRVACGHTLNEFWAIPARRSRRP